VSTDIARKLTPEHRRRRLARVRFLRRTLPLAAGMGLVAVVGQVSWRSVQAAAAPAPVASEHTVRMVNPQFSGEGRDGSRYLLTAKSGVRDPKDAARIVLQRPVVSVSRNGQPGAHTVSQRGVFREDDQSLTLEGDVQVEEAGGFRFVANNAVIDTATGRVKGGGVQGQGPVGAVRSDSYSVTEKGDRMVFKGGVRGQLQGR
jgi:lipopolysaccharide export system protein LptC